MGFDPIRNMEYVTVTSRKGIKGSGLEIGDELLVVGTKVLPVKKSDPYLQRVYVVCVKVVDGIHQIPNDAQGEGDNGYRSYLIDPRALTRMDSDDQDRFRELLETQYGKNDS